MLRHCMAVIDFTEMRGKDSVIETSTTLIKALTNESFGGGMLILCLGTV